MKLEDKISAVFNELHIEKLDTGRLILQSDLLDLMLEPEHNTRNKLFKPIAFVKNTINQNTIIEEIAKQFETYTTQKIAKAKNKEEKQIYERLENAFEFYQNIKINNIQINKKTTNKTNFLKQNTRIITIGAIIGMQTMYPDMIPNLQGYIYSAIAITSAADYVSSHNSSFKQQVKLKTPSIESIKKDIKNSSKKYHTAKNKYEQLKGYITLNISSFRNEINQLKMKVAAEKLDKKNSKKILKTYEQIYKYTKNKSENSSIRLDVSFSDFNFNNINNLKKITDKYAQKYFPTLNLENITIKLIENSETATAYVLKGKPNTIYMSKSSLSLNKLSFFSTYAHELTHCDGCDSESIATHRSYEIINDMKKEFPEQELELQEYILTGAIQTYINERKKELNKYTKQFNNFKKIIEYETKINKSMFHETNFPDKSQIGNNKIIFNELIDLNAPKELIETAFDIEETLLISKQVNKIRKKMCRDTYKGYTIDFYKLAKQNGKI